MTTHTLKVNVSLTKVKGKVPHHTTLLEVKAVYISVSKDVALIEQSIESD